MLMCGILRKRAHHFWGTTWKQKYVVVTIGKLIWYPIPPSMTAFGPIVLTEQMKAKKHEMSMLSKFICNLLPLSLFPSYCLTSSFGRNYGTSL